MVDSNYNFLGLKLSGLWVKIKIVKRLSKIINVNRLNIPSTAAESLKVLEKRPETAVNFAIFECVTDCVMCDASGHSLCSRMDVFTSHTTTEVHAWLKHANFKTSSPI